MRGAAGGVALMAKGGQVALGPWLPAASRANAIAETGPSGRGTSLRQEKVPSPSTGAVQSVAAFGLPAFQITSTEAPGSQVPSKVGRCSRESGGCGASTGAGGGTVSIT
jgi:hypothetical protein